MIKNFIIYFKSYLLQKSSIRKIRFGPYKGLKYTITPSLEGEKGIFTNAGNLMYPAQKETLHDDMILFALVSRRNSPVVYIHFN